MKKTIRVKQRDISDCGAACLASVAAFYGLQIPVTRIRQYAGTNKQGTSLYGLLEAAEKLNFQAKGARTKAEGIQSIPLPAIFHTVLENSNQHFVVLYKIRKQSVSYMDPAIGKLIREPLAEFKKRWSGVVLLMLPAQNFQRCNEKKSAFIRFRQLIMPHRRMLMQALVGALIYTILGLSTSVYVQKIVDFVLPDANKPLMNLLSIIMIILLTFQVIIGYLKSMIALRTGQQIDSWLILGYYKHLLELPQRFFDSMRVGEIISRVNDAVRIRVFINDVALGLVVHALTIVFSMILMCMYNWKLAMIMLLTMPFYGLIYVINNKVNAKWQRKMMECGAALESQLVETVQGVTTIRRFGAAEYFNLKTENRFIPFMRSIFSSSHNGLLLANMSEWITHLLTISILWAGSYLVINRILSPGELLSFYTLTAFFSTPVQALIGANRPMQDALIAADRLFEIIDLETEKESSGSQLIRHFPDGDLVFNNIVFSYGDSNPVFSGLKLTIRRNRMTAVIGESGCGKSTLLSLLQKLYPLQGGEIFLGNTGIQNIATGLLRKHIVAVPQHTDLFEGDFIANICLGEENPDLEKIFELSKRLGLHEFISRLPAQYQTIIREQGMNLSGGQKQRMGIARALYRNPSVLVLDEATSSLDPESERRVQATLSWFFDETKTIIIIAHRLSTIRYCDSIVYLRQDGKAVSGTHESLMEADSDYAGWWQNGVGKV